MNPEDKIIATDMLLTAPALQVADVKFQVPAVYDSNYIDITLNICKEQYINAIICLNDLELPILAKEKKRFEQLGIKVIVSSPKVIDIAFDKYKTAKWIESIGLYTPKTYVRLADVITALKIGEIEFPLFMKPRWGTGSIGLETIDSFEEMETAYRYLLNKIKKTIIASVSVGDEYIIIQEKLTGNEYGLDVMNDLEAHNVAVSVKHKLSMRAGETDKAVTVDIPEVRNIGEVIGRNLQHVGNLDVDVMQRANGDFCVLELNPRFGGGFPFSYEAGVNMPKAILMWLQGKSVDPQILQPEYGRMFAKNDYLMEIK